MKILPYALLILLCMPFQCYALECPKIPEQTNKEWDVEVKAAVGKIGPVKGAELETRTKKAVHDLMGKLPQADKVYLEQMMYATYCSALRDDKKMSESEKAERIRTYNFELRKSLFGPSEKRDPKQKGALPGDDRTEARLRLNQMSLPFTSDAFIESVKKGDIDAAKLFLAAGMDPNARDKDGNTALIYAVREGHRKIIDFLLKVKADVNEKGERGFTAVSWATVRGKKDILIDLLKHDASVATFNGAFVTAASYGNRDVLDVLIKRKIDFKGRVAGKSVVDEALLQAIGAHYSVPENDLSETVQYLLDLGADVNAQYKEGDMHYTPLLSAIDKRRTAIARTLLDRGADPDIRWLCSGCYSHGMTPLIMATDRGMTDIVEALLDRGADIDKRWDQATDDRNRGETALMRAVSSGNIDAARILINRSAGLNIRSDRGESAFLLAAQQRNPIILNIMIDKGVDVNQVNIRGSTALMHASGACNVDNVRILLGRGADINIQDNNSESALIFAVSAYGCDEKVDLVRTLLDNGADINARNKERKTALMAAAALGNIEIVTVLLDRGADVNAKDLYGRTALDLAERSQLTGEPRDKMLGLLKNAAGLRQ